MNDPLRLGLVLLLVLAVSAVMALAANTVLLIFIGAVFGTFLHFLSRHLAQRVGASRRLALALIVLGLIGLLFLGGTVLGERLAAELDSLVQQAPDLLEALDARFPDRSLAQELLDNLEASVNAVLSGSGEGADLLQRGAGVLRRLAGAFSSAAGTLVAGVIVFTIAVYLALEPGLYVRGVVALASPRHQDDVERLCGRLERVIGLWFLGQGISMAVLGTIMSLGLWGLGVPYPLLFGAFTALMTFVPNVGPLIAAVPPLLVALTLGSGTTAAVLVLIVVVQNIEGLLLTPLIHRHNIALPPALVLATLLVLGSVTGVLGMFVAMPLIAVAITSWQTLVLEPRAERG